MYLFHPRLRTDINVCVAAVVFASVFSSQVYAHGNDGSVRKNGRFTPNVEGAEFPPQPRRVEDVKQYKPKKRTAVELQNLERRMAAVLENTSVQEALGNRYAHIHTAPFKQKGIGVANQYRILFFSHTNNQTVTVISIGQNIKSLVIENAAVEQPALAQSEHDESIALAKQYWLDRGKSSVNTLTPYAIQTFQPDGSPFPTRMVYVSFHVNSPEAPLLYNWVDLTTQEVTTGEDE